MNKNFWELYKNSARGKEMIDLFSLDKTRDVCKIKDNCLDEKGELLGAKFIEYLGGDYIDMTFYYYNLKFNPNYFFNKTNAEAFFTNLIDNLELFPILLKEAETFNDSEFIGIDQAKQPIIPSKIYKHFCSELPELSLALYFLYDDIFFIPMLFREKFDVFMKILDVLSISIPDLPAKSDKRGRLLFYSKINNNVKNFAISNNLSKAETCACIYDFALMVIGEDVKDSLLPEPTNIWLTGGSKYDYKEFLQNPKEGAKSVWTCSEYTKRGDIIVMYVLSPYSCIQSVWRADIDGVYTPFNFYNSRTKATDGILIPPITLNELKADSYFSKLPITRKNFQGVNGVKFSATDYKELQRMLVAKGFDVAVLPQLYNPGIEFEHELKNEKDVEEKLLIPLLSKLGFAESDWTRQLSQKAGRKEKAIPDFVFLPKGEIHFQNAPMIIEAKFDMGTNIERTKTYNQALSYARIMKSKIFGICDRDRLIIYKEKEGHFNRFTPTFEKHWQSINNAEIYAELKLLIGKDAIK